MPPKVVKFPEFPFIVRFYDFLRDEVFRVASLFVFGCNAMRCGSSTSKVIHLQSRETNKGCFCTEHKFKADAYQLRPYSKGFVQVIGSIELPTSAAETTR